VSADPSPARHDLVWLRGGAEVRLAEPGRARDVERWIALGRPAVARRLDASVPPGHVALGISLPAAAGRARIALSVPPGAIARIAPPPRLAEAVPSAPVGWRRALGALDAEAAAAGVALHLHGSLAWQHLTGEAYLREGSDVDLLVAAAGDGGPARALALLARWAAHAAPRLDGELLLGGGRGVAWRELLGAPVRVLVKASASVALEPVASALARGGGP
jgi:phosphoribosyl-dephospho-CoA transferase